MRHKTFKNQIGTTLPGSQTRLLSEASGSGALASGPCGNPIVFVHPILQQHLGVRQLLEWSVYSKAKATSAVYQVLYSCSFLWKKNSLQLPVGGLNETHFTSGKHPSTSPPN